MTELTMTFGRFNGRRLDMVPTWYLKRLITDCPWYNGAHYVKVCDILGITPDDKRSQIVDKISCPLHETEGNSL